MSKLVVLIIILVVSLVLLRTSGFEMVLWCMVMLLLRRSLPLFFVFGVSVCLDLLFLFPLGTSLLVYSVMVLVSSFIARRWGAVVTALFVTVCVILFPIAIVSARMSVITVLCVCIVSVFLHRKSIVALVWN